MMLLVNLWPLQFFVGGFIAVLYSIPFLGKEIIIFSLPNSSSCILGF